MSAHEDLKQAKLAGAKSTLAVYESQFNSPVSVSGIVADDAKNMIGSDLAQSVASDQDELRKKIAALKAEIAQLEAS